MSPRSGVRPSLCSMAKILPDGRSTMLGREELGGGGWHAGESLDPSRTLSPPPNLRTSNCTWSSNVDPSPIAAHTYEAVMRFKLKPTRRRSRPATTRAASMASSLPRRSYPARLEYGKALTLPWSGEQSRGVAGPHLPPRQRRGTRGLSEYRDYSRRIVKPGLTTLQFTQWRLGNIDSDCR